MKKKISIILSLVVIISMTMGITSYASDGLYTKDNNVLQIEHKSEGEILKFKSIDNEVIVPKARLRSNGSTIWSYKWYAGTDEKVVEKAIDKGSYNISKSFVKYLTDSWAKANSYTWSKSNTTTWSVDGGVAADVADNVRINLGLSKSRTTSYQVAVTIPAKSNKFSKLGFASDFFKQNYRYEMWVNDSKTQSDNGSIKTPTEDTYLIVYYK